MKIIKRIKSDKAVSNTVSFILMLGFIMTLLISFIDAGIYFNVKNQMTSAAENGARSVALYGGVNNSLRKAKGNRKFNVEDTVMISIPNQYKGNGPRAHGSQVVELGEIVCGYQDDTGNLTPFPTRFENTPISAGDMVYCDVSYNYTGIAGKFGLFQLGKGLQGEDFKKVNVRGTSVSEVTIER